MEFEEAVVNDDLAVLQQEVDLLRNQNKSLGEQVMCLQSQLNLKVQQVKKLQLQPSSSSQEIFVGMKSIQQAGHDSAVQQLKQQLTAAHKQIHELKVQKEGLEAQILINKGLTMPLDQMIQTEVDSHQFDDLQSKAKDVEVLEGNIDQCNLKYTEETLKLSSKIGLLELQLKTYKEQLEAAVGRSRDQLLTIRGLEDQAFKDERLMVVAFNFLMHQYLTQKTHCDLLGLNIEKDLTRETYERLIQPFPECYVENIREKMTAAQRLLNIFVPQEPLPDQSLATVEVIGHESDISVGPGKNEAVGVQASSSLADVHIEETSPCDGSSPNVVMYPSSGISPVEYVPPNSEASHSSVVAPSCVNSLKPASNPVYFIRGIEESGSCGFTVFRGPLSEFTVSGDPSTVITDQLDLSVDTIQTYVGTSELAPNQPLSSKRRRQLMDTSIEEESVSGQATSVKGGVEFIQGVGSSNSDLGNKDRAAGQSTSGYAKSKLTSLLIDAKEYFKEGLAGHDEDSSSSKDEEDFVDPPPPKKKRKKATVVARDTIENDDDVDLRRVVVFRGGLYVCALCRKKIPKFNHLKRHMCTAHGLHIMTSKGKCNSDKCEIVLEGVSDSNKCRAGKLLRGNEEAMKILEKKWLDKGVKEPWAV